MAATAVAPEVKEAIDLGKSNQKSLGDLNKKLDGLVDKLSKTPANMGQHPWQQGFAPHARVGEDPMSSRGFKFLKMLGLLTQGCTREQAKHEHSVHERLTKAYEQAGFVWGGAGRTGETRFLAPLASSFQRSSFCDIRYSFCASSKVTPASARRAMVWPYVLLFILRSSVG